MQAKLTHTHTHARTRAHTHAHTHTRTRAHTHTHARAHMRACAHFVMCRHARSHAHSPTPKHTLTHALTLSRTRPLHRLVRPSASQLASCVHVARQWRTKNIVIAGNGPAPSSRRKLPTAKPIKRNRHTRVAQAGMALGRPSPTALGRRNRIACAVCVCARRACAIAARPRAHDGVATRPNVCVGVCARARASVRACSCGRVFRGRNARVCAKACQSSELTACARVRPCELHPSAPTRSPARAQGT